MQRLLVLANEFPYGVWEPYMETEEKYYSKFDKTWIASLQLRDNHAKTRRPLICAAKVIPVKYASRAFYLLNSITVLTDKNLYKEIALLRKCNRLNISRLIDLFVFLSRAHHEARVIHNSLKKEKTDGITIYSYRFEYQPYVALLLKKWWKNTQKIVCRAHGYDLYEEQHENDYIPLREYILNNVDYVYPCSKYGVEYIRVGHPKTGAVVSERYLGTVDHGIRETHMDQGCLKIVSCSTVVRVKRIEKIIGALSAIKDLSIEWIHFGDGVLLDDLKQLADRKLGDNVRYSFPGNILNTELLKWYEDNDVHVFINVSSSEGVPVSIMEAGSFGIPCIATDVGGTKELVNDTNGILISSDVDDDEIAKIIRLFAQTPDSDYQELRKATRKFWEDHFDAEKNYNDFINDLIEQDGR